MARHHVSILVPTRNERDNVVPLVSRIAAAVGSLDAEVVFIDDSDDQTPEVVTDVASGSALPVQLIHRTPEHRLGGLGGAVKAGIEGSDSEWIVVMDGDLQHPPELIPELISSGQLQALDLVVASRYCGGGDATGLSCAAREIISSGATMAAHLLFPRALSGVTDPMSGFFAFRRSALDASKLEPNGFKILLEILVRSRQRRVGEVPFVFGDRNGGMSKASWREGVRYVRQLFRLRFGRELQARPAKVLGPLQIKEA